MYDLIIIGGGPAAITAGIYAARQRLNTLLISREMGGQLLKKAGMIENYPGFEEISGLDLIQKFEKHLRKFPVDIEIDEIIRLEKQNNKFSVLTKTKKEFQSKTVIIASGADPRPLEIPGEKEYLGKGLSYCVTCDGFLFKDKNVAVIGGGNSALEAAIYLSKIAKKVYILEASPEVRADKENQELVKKTRNVEILTSVLLKKIQGEKFVKSLIYEDRKTGKEKTLAVEGVFVEVGYQPATAFVKDLVDFNEKDEIIVDFETYQTKTPGLFAAGDCNIGKYKQIITATGEGAKAALAAYDYLQSQNKNKK
jgi:thioredoxin-disulfide reductase